MRNIRENLTYANVASTLALVVALGGGGAAVALAVARDSVGSPQIINGSIKHKDLTIGVIGVVRAYAWLEDAAPLEDQPIVLVERAYNSGGGDVTVTRTGTGVYTIDFEGLGGARNVQVTANENTPNYCKVSSWTSDRAYVSCFNPAGNPANTAWQIAMIE